MKCAMTSSVDQADIERGLREIGLREGHAHRPFPPNGWRLRPPPRPDSMALSLRDPEGTLLAAGGTGVAGWVPHMAPAQGLRGCRFPREVRVAGTTTVTPVSGGVE